MAKQISPSPLSKTWAGFLHLFGIAGRGCLILSHFLSFWRMEDERNLSPSSPQSHLSTIICGNLPSPSPGECHDFELFSSFIGTFFWTVQMETSFSDKFQTPGTLGELSLCHAKQTFSTMMFPFLFQEDSLHCLHTGIKGEKEKEGIPFLSLSLPMCIFMYVYNYLFPFLPIFALW